MSKQRVEILVIGAGRHQQKIKAAIYKALDGEFSEAAKWSFPESTAHIDFNGPVRDLSLQVLSMSIDNDQLSSGTVSAEAIQGITTGYAIDPLESAISSALSAIRDERESGKGLSINDHDNREGVLSILGGHLVRLLELQVTQLGAPTVITCDQVGDITHTEITSGRQ